MYLPANSLNGTAFFTFGIFIKTISIPEKQ